jgi:hypothetical protein
MNDLDGIIVTVAKTLMASGLIPENSHDEIIPLAITVTEKIISKGYAKIDDFSVDVFDDEWFQKLYDAVYDEPSVSVIDELPTELELSSEEPAYDGGYSFESPYDDDELELYSNDDAPEADDLLEAPAEPKIRYPERAERKILDPEEAKVNAPSWATLKPKA